MGLTPKHQLHEWVLRLRYPHPLAAAVVDWTDRFLNQPDEERARELDVHYEMGRSRVAHTHDLLRAVAAHIASLTIATAIGHWDMRDEKDTEHLLWFTLAARLRMMLPPSAEPPELYPPDVVAPDAPAAAAFTDDEAWTNAVASQGIVVPRGDEYYLSTHWAMLNDQLKRGRCVECGPWKQTRTRLHHLTADRFGNERPEDVIELCDRHHARRHGAGVWKKAA